MATQFCERCKATHPGRECDYDPKTGECAETKMRTLHMLHSLDCEKGQFGTTVRKGNKWADAFGLTLELCVCEVHPALCCIEHKISGHGLVTDIWEGKFKDVPARYLEYEHEIRSRQYSGLLESMRKAYGQDFNEDEQVVILTYLRED